MKKKLNNNFKIEMVATDLDGTLLRDDKTISAADLDTLKRLGEKGIVRVAATGRSLFKVKEVLLADTPVDYIVFSSGAGIYDWRKGKLLQREHFEKPTFEELCKHMLSGNYNFFVYQPIPKNNLFVFHKGAGECNEFENYLERHEGDYEMLDTNNLPKEASQIMSIIPNDENLFETLKTRIHNDCKGVKVIRTTSPMQTDYIWLEIFPDTVSKGHGLKWLCDHLGINHQKTLGIGNDYNDLDLFKFVSYPYLLNNGVELLKEQFNNVHSSNEQSGVSTVVGLFDF